MELAQVGPRQAHLGERARAPGVLPSRFGCERVPVGNDLSARGGVSYTSGDKEVKSKPLTSSMSTKTA